MDAVIRNDDYTLLPGVAANLWSFSLIACKAWHGDNEPSELTTDDPTDGGPAPPFDTNDHKRLSHAFSWQKV